MMWMMKYDATIFKKNNKITIRKHSRLIYLYLIYLKRGIFITNNIVHV